MPDTHATPEAALQASHWSDAPTAQAAAAQTPRTVRAAMLAGPRTVCGITLQPLSLDILWALEAIAHPLATPGAPGELSHLRIAQMIYAFAEPAAALQAASMGTDGAETLTSFDHAAFAFIRRHVTNFADLPKLGEAIAQLIQEGLSPAPGGANPPTPAAH